MNNRNIQHAFSVRPVGGGINKIILGHGNNNYTSKSLYDKIFFLENVFLAWYKFAKSKHSRRDVMIYERNLEENLFNLQAELKNQNYCHGKYQPFIVYDPKKRQIHKTTVKDRIVHQAVVNIIEPIFEKRFIFDSFSCRIGKGIHGASYRLRDFLSKASQNNTKTIYALKCDVSKFFDSIDHNILLDFICCQIKDEKTIKLLRHIIGSFSKAPNKGLPLGNLTSQLFANIYLK